MNNFRREYRYAKPFGNAEHVWLVECSRGAVHLYIRESSNGKFYGVWSYITVSHLTIWSFSAPSHERCWILNGPCWHDGSSLQATEVWIPIWDADPHNHEAMLDRLEGEMVIRFDLEGEA